MQRPPLQEKIADQINKAIEMGEKIRSDKLNPTNVIGTPAFSHTSLSNCNGAGASGYHLGATAYTALKDETTAPGAAVSNLLEKQQSR